jgi:hypothetical protein
MHFPRLRQEVNLGVNEARRSDRNHTECREEPEASATQGGTYNPC